MCIFCVNLSKLKAIQAANHKQHSILKFLWVSYVCTYLSQGALQLATHTAGVTNCQEVNSRKQGKEHIQEQNLRLNKQDIQHDFLEVPAPQFSIFQHGFMTKTKKKTILVLYFLTMIFCNTISLQSNSHGFPSSGGGGGLPPQQPNICLLPPT